MSGPTGTLVPGSASTEVRASPAIVLDTLTRTSRACSDALAAHRTACSDSDYFGRQAWRSVMADDLANAVMFVRRQSRAEAERRQAWSTYREAVGELLAAVEDLRGSHGR